MARPRSTISRKKRLEQQLKTGLDRLKSARETLDNAANQVLGGKRPKPGTFNKITNAQYREMVALEKRFGLYNPKGDKLTTARKSAIRKHWDQLEGLMQDAVFAEYPKGTKPGTRAKIDKELRQAYPNEKGRRKTQLTTKKGIWVPRSEKQIVNPIGSLEYDRRLGLHAVKVTKRAKKGYIAKEMRYIAGPSVLNKKIEQLQKRLGSLPPLKKNQRYRFMIGTNLSRRSFRTVDQMVKYINGYRRDDQARATLMDQLTYEIVQRGPAVERWIGKGKRRHKVKDRYTDPVRAFRGNRLTEVHPDILRDMMEEMEDDDE